MGYKYLYKLVFSLFPDICPGVGLLDHTVVLFLFFWETPIRFSILAAPIYIPTNSIRGFPFHHILTNTRDLWSYWWYHSDRCKVVSHFGFDLHIPDDYQCWTLYHLLVGHLSVFFGKIFIQVLSSFYIGFFGYFLMLSYCKLMLPLPQCSQSTCSPLV